MLLEKMRRWSSSLASRAPSCKVSRAQVPSGFKRNLDQLGSWSNMDSSLLFVSTFSPNPRRLAHLFCLPCFQEKLQQMTKILSLFQTSSIVIVHNQFVSGLLILHIRRTMWYLHVWLKSLCVWRFWSQPQDLCVHLNNLRIQDKIAAMSRGRRVASWRENNSWNFLAGWSSSLPCF